MERASRVADAAGGCQLDRVDVAGKADTGHKRGRQHLVPCPRRTLVMTSIITSWSVCAPSKAAHAASVRVEPACTSGHLGCTGNTCFPARHQADGPDGDAVMASENTRRLAKASDPDAYDRSGAGVGVDRVHQHDIRERRRIFVQSTKFVSKSHNESRRIGSNLGEIRIVYNTFH